MRFGSGSPLLGGTSALQEALARRGVDASILQQVGGNAPTAMPASPPLQGSTMPMPAMSSASSTATSPLPSGTPEAELILKALSERLRSDSKIKEAQAIPPKMSL